MHHFCCHRCLSAARPRSASRREAAVSTNRERSASSDRLAARGFGDSPGESDRPSCFGRSIPQAEGSFFPVASIPSTLTKRYSPTWTRSITGAMETEGHRPPSIAKHRAARIWRLTALLLVPGVIDVDTSRLEAASILGWRPPASICSTTRRSNGSVSANA
jgi:hypothetical protein